MKTIKDKDLAAFLKDSPLYSKFKLFEKGEDIEEISIFEYFEDKAYKFYCPFEKEYHTFKIDKKCGDQFKIMEKMYLIFILEKVENSIYHFN